MSRSFPQARFRSLDDVELVRLLVRDPLGRLDVVEFFYREYGEVLMAVAIAVAREGGGEPTAGEYEELASLVVESLAELLEYGRRPHPTFRAVADGEPGAELRLLPYVKQILRNKIHQSWRGVARQRAVASALAEAGGEANILYPDFERRGDLEQLREAIAALRLGGAEKAVAEVYLAQFPDRPDFPSLCAAQPGRSEKGVRNAEARFVAKLQKEVAR